MIRRTLFTPVLFSLLLMLLAACAAAQPTGLTVMVFGDIAEQAAYQGLVDSFNAQHPELRAVLLTIPGQSDYRQRVATDIAAGAPADVILLNYRRYAAFAASGALTPLDDYIAADNYDLSGFYPETIAPFRYDGRLLCLAQNLSSLVVYYNADLFNAAGVALPTADWTWDDFLAAAQQLTQDSDGDGITDVYGLGTEVSFNRLAPFIWQAGGELVDAAQQPTRLTLDTPPARRALQWFVDLQLVHHVTPDAVAEESESSESRFLNGRLAMLLNSRRGVPTYRTIETFTWNVAPLPQDQQQAGILHADGYCIPAAARQPDAAWRFIAFANSAEGQAQIVASGRTVPSRRSVAESPAFLAGDQPPAANQVFVDHVERIRAVPVHPNWPQIEDIVSEELQQAYYGRIDIATMLQRVAQQTTPLFGGE
jgi:multiple sugar transport system substrate-binding protein